MFNNFIQGLIVFVGLCLFLDGIFGLFFPKQARRLIENVGGEAAEMFRHVKPRTLRAIACAEALCGTWLLAMFAVGQGWISIWN